MKLTLNLFLLSLVFLGSESFALTNYQIKKICKKEIRESNCIKNLLQKKSDLQKGNVIEIPVIPYKR